MEENENEEKIKISNNIELINTKLEKLEGK